MKLLCQVILILMLLCCLTGCNGQTKTSPQKQQSSQTSNNKPVGGGCDGCELMYVGMPAQLNATDTSAGWAEPGQKLLVTGTVFKRNAKTPAPDVILYYWQTDQKGLYTPKAGMNEQAKRHGRLRGWVKTDANGKYAIYTTRPVSYPNSSMQAHIHVSVKEPGIADEYYIDDLVFDDDKLMNSKERKSHRNRGGSGILRVLLSGDVQVAERDIILGMNIPNYPETLTPAKQSGLQIGEDSPSFMPTHAWGPDKGTKTCPVCKYGRYHGIVYFVGNNPDWTEIKKWLTFLEQESIARSNYLKAYLVYGNEKNYRKETRQKELEQIGKELNLKKVALTFVPSMADTESEADRNKINPAVENTFVIYRHRRIVDKFIDLKPTAENFKMVSATLDKTKSDYFHLPEPRHD